MEENSLLVHRIGGQMYQVLSDETALYVVYLGNVRSRASLYRALMDPSEFRPGPGMERIEKGDAESISILLGIAQTEIYLRMRTGEEHVWHVNCCVPEEGLRRIFDGIDMEIGLLPNERALVEIDPEDLPEGLYDSLRIRQELLGSDKGPEKQPKSGTEILVEGGMNAFSVLFPALWWLHHSKLLFFCNLLMLPLGLALLARKVIGEGRLSPKRALWLLPGVAMLMINIRVNLPHPAQILLPAAVISGVLALTYMLLCGKKRRWRRIALVLAVCLLTYGPGAALSVNSLKQETLRVVKSDPLLIRPQWVDVRVDGVIRRFYASPEVTRTLSSAAWCELRHCRGLLGIEYWVIVPEDGAGAI